MANREFEVEMKTYSPILRPIEGRKSSGEIRAQQAKLLALSRCKVSLLIRVHDGGREQNPEPEGVS